ncbi:hypothetical protein [Pararcticibacter amylolyticus]|uniref:Uncharacterized protein n=1 Tax=Pararcticibacter amylolyticus TaxID=2173175 RepID=A0A2U2PHC8_9SPHI|nr:hypothetical protein [Pararcticibacter amylolyticus]PWG80654.1 hypothetical protein DDR33_11570 [Pararcticibacter amylolyticus]
MKVGRQFNTLTFEEYMFFIDNHKKYSDFNTLGLYRSLIENPRLDENQRILVRDYANKKFEKTFQFLQVKDPWTFIKVKTLGLELTKSDKDELWRMIVINQEKILRDKRIKHRNFGEYSKHNCGYETCPMNGMMIKQGSYFAEYEMCIGNVNKRLREERAKDRKLDRKRASLIINKELDLSTREK